MRRVFPLSSGWRFRDSPLDEAWLDEGFSPEGWEAVDLPHSLRELPLNHFDEGACQGKAVYCHDFPAPTLPDGGKAFLDFEGVAVSCAVWINGKRAGGHRGPYTPFSMDITDFLKPEGTNRLLVEVDAREDPSIPPFGGVVDYLVYGGIYRAVWLRTQGRAFIGRIHAHPSLKEGQGGAGLAVEVTMVGAGGMESLTLAARLGKNGSIVAETREGIPGPGAGPGPGPSPGLSSGTSHGPGKEGVFRIDFPGLTGILPWDLDRPELYDLEIALESGELILDRLSERIGFRNARFTREGFFLNGRRVFLRGLNRHQSWPYAGYAMGPGAQRRDAEILKRELGINIVRTSHYPQSRHFLDACDELGLLVFTEMPGWQHIGDAAWKDRALADLGDLIRRDCNHPSIILWGVRVNESPDDDDFYARTNALASKLDPDRQRGGVRNFRRSRLLEDVYTFNDFTHEGGKAALASPGKVKGRARTAPYLVTEHNGHMFPAKRQDQEERLAEHARRHARVLDAAMGDSGISGAIGWCAFDYNTHKDFGSGDRICYHGVSDMFRIPKPAASLYSSQKDPASGIVLEPATIFAKGERSASRPLPVEVYTNCDAVDLYHAGEKVGRYYPDRGTYPHLDHPPVVIGDLIGDRIDSEGFGAADKAIFLSLASKSMGLGSGRLGIPDKLRFLLFSLRRHVGLGRAEALVMKYGYGWGQADDVFEVVGIIGDKEAARRTFGPDAHARKLEAVADAPVLHVKPGDEWDAVRVVVSLVDQYGNRCPFGFEPIGIKVSGAGRLIGPAETCLMGGATAFWVASLGEEGKIRISVSNGRFGTRTIGLKAEKTHE